MTLATAITEVKLEMVTELLDRGSVMNAEIYHILMDLIILQKGCTFENEVAEGNFKTAVSNAIAGDYPYAYDFAFPKQGMDVNGNYTTDSTKWV